MPGKEPPGVLLLIGTLGVTILSVAVVFEGPAGETLATIGVLVTLCAGVAFFARLLDSVGQTRWRRAGSATGSSGDGARRHPRRACGGGP